MSSASEIPDQPPILRVALALPLPTLFDYYPPPEQPIPPVGSRVHVPFGRRRMVGIVMEHGVGSELDQSRIQPALAGLDEGAVLFNAELAGLLHWCWRYYKHPEGVVVFNAVPSALRKPQGALPGPPLSLRITTEGRHRLAEAPGRAPAQWDLLRRLDPDPVPEAELSSSVNGYTRLRRRLEEEGWVERVFCPPATMTPQPGPRLNTEQRDTAEAVIESLGSFRCHLVDGVTGSGKTEVYLTAIEQTLEQGGQVLVLVPEIGLTPQLVDRFRTRLGLKPFVTHSGCADGERLATFAAARDGRARLVIGTRSALFLPFKELRLLVLDEEHDASFRQQDGFRYSARDVAVKRARELNVPVVLGSATPSLESLHNAKQGRYLHHRLTRRATGADMPHWRVMDLCQQPTTSGIAESAFEEIGDALQRDEQVLVFLNRRGFAPALICHDCGWHATCDRCDAHMTWHRTPPILRCHHCSASRPVPQLCPECGADALQGAGEGTEQLERVLCERFPDVSLLRFDRDTTRRRDEFEERARQVQQGGACILVGTQMLAKGHHFPDVTLVLVVNLDQALFSSDFRAIERMGQVLIQVAGRAGRASRPGQVILQTHNPAHPALERLTTDGYAAFAADLMAERRAAALPPAGYLAMLRADAHQREDVTRFLEAAARVFPQGEGTLSPPLPALMERRGGRVRWYSLVQATERTRLHGQLSQWLRSIWDLPESRSVRWALDVDPLEF